jgi:hypothetical protein
LLRAVSNSIVSSFVFALSVIVVANSWTQYWGLGGFFYIRLGTNECGIEAAAVVADAILPAVDEYEGYHVNSASTTHWSRTLAASPLLALVILRLAGV